MPRNKLATAVSLAGIVAGAALGQQTAGTSQPQILEGQVETRQVAKNLGTTLEQLESESSNPFWIAYSVEKIAGESSVCGESYNENAACCTCSLEKEGAGVTNNRQSRVSTDLEGGHQLAVLMRVADKQVMKIRTASTDCNVKAGGMRVVWLTAVNAQESVALLENYVRPGEMQEHGDHGMSEQALTAIALHADAAADRAFASFVASTQPVGLREKASFWLGAARGAQGLVLLEHMAKSDPSAGVRAQVSFALFMSKQPGAVEEMIRMAHDDQSAPVRGQALFWLAQKAGKKAQGAITGAIENDPDTEVKKKAVFALSQMPKEEGVPKLIQVAQTNKNPEVRKQAMFWLGQSNDPRALAFFEKVLSQ
jgi:hypothetical protein